MASKWGSGSKTVIYFGCGVSMIPRAFHRSFEYHINVAQRTSTYEDLRQISNGDITIPIYFDVCVN